MRFSSILGNDQSLDGGAMFGNAPKVLWQRWLTPDSENRVQLSCRALLMETQSQKVLFETGVGAYMEPKLAQRYGLVSHNHVLLDHLSEKGLSDAAISSVVLSHLHFDHAGGLLSAYVEGKAPQLLFPNATYYVGRKAWERACSPHPRDRASFIPELQTLLEDSGRLVLIEEDDSLFFDNVTVNFFVSDGHTPGMLLADIRSKDQRVVFGADLIPGKPWVHLPITMGYDRFPEGLIDEKKELLESLVNQGGWLFFTHDPDSAAARIQKDSVSGRYLAISEQAELSDAALFNSVDLTHTE